MPDLFIPGGPRTPEPLFDDHEFAAQRGFFDRRPALAPTPLRDCVALARHLNIGRLLVKDETGRFGLNAFKSAGATFAVTTLVDRGEVRRGDTLVCASEGNHGRAVARAAAAAGCRARVYMAESVAPARIEAIRGERAEVVLVPGTYDDAVRETARQAAAHGWTIVSDTSWDGYEEIPRLIMLGYTRILDEDDRTGTIQPPLQASDVIVVPGGVGGLLGAVASWCAWRFGAARPRIVCVEPLSAACLLESARRGTPVTLSGPFATTMGGLRCGEVSPAAFPAVRSIVDAFVAIEDDYAFDAMRLLGRPAPPDPAVACGPSGAAAVGGLLATLTHPRLAALKDALDVGPSRRVLAIATEGVTDPRLYAEVLAAR